MSKFGKFSSAEELARGYEQLERTFTQKCQQLARLQEQISQQTNGVDNESETLPTQPITVQPLCAPQATDSAVNELSADCDSPSAQGEQQSSASDGTSQQPPAEQDVSTVPQDEQSLSWRKVGNEEQQLQALQQFLDQNPRLKQRLLQGVPQQMAPSLMTGGGDVSLAQPSKPRTVKEASAMAKHLFD